MESINRRFSDATGYDLQHMLFTNNLRAFHNRGSRRTTRVESIRARQMNQPIHELIIMHQKWKQCENIVEKAPNDLQWKMQK